MVLVGKVQPWDKRTCPHLSLVKLVIYSGISGLDEFFSHSKNGGSSLGGVVVQQLINA